MDNGFHDTRLPVDIERGAMGGPRFKTTVVTLASGHEQRNVEWSQARGEWDISYGLQTANDLREVVEFFYARMGRAHTFRFKDWNDFEMAEQVIAISELGERSYQLRKTYGSGAFTYIRDITKPVEDTVDARTHRNLGGALKWNESSTAGEYYLTTDEDEGPLPDGAPNEVVVEGSSDVGTPGSLAPGEWGFGNADDLGFNTLYVRLSGDSDPAQASPETIQVRNTEYSVDHVTGQVTFDRAPVPGSSVLVSAEFDVHARFDVDQLQVESEVVTHGGNTAAGTVPQIPIVEVR